VGLLWHFPECWQRQLRGVGWSVCLGISCSIGSKVDRLHNFIFTLSLFSHRLKGALAATLLVRMFRSALGIRTCCGSTVYRASFFYLCSGDTNISLKTSYRRRIFEVV
jgi:hypothetical protein